jgi:hypothetical protein
MPEALTFDFLFGRGDTSPDRLGQKTAAAIKVLKKQFLKVRNDTIVDDVACFELFDDNANPWPQAGANKAQVPSDRLLVAEDRDVLEDLIYMIVTASPSLATEELAHITLRIPLHDPVDSATPRKTAWQHILENLMDDE